MMMRMNTMTMTFAAEMTRRNRMPDVLTVSSSALTRASVLISTIMIIIILIATLFNAGAYPRPQTSLVDNYVGDNVADDDI